MKRWPHYSTLIVTILMVLAISALWTVPVLADDATPPPTTNPEVVQPSNENSGTESHPVTASTEAPPPAVEEAPTDAVVSEVPPAEAVPTEAPVTEASPTEAPVSEASPSDATPRDAPVAEHAPKQQTTTDALAHLPDNTDLVVLDANGTAVPLASQAAADLIQTGDPIWCPVGVAPKPGIGGCTPTQPNLLTLINNFISGTLADPGTNGIIWITGFATNLGAPDTSASPIVIDGNNASLGAWKNFSLTLNGGWTGASTGVMNIADPSQINVPLSIINWNGNVTLNNLLVTGVTSGTALTVSTTKNITATRVNVKNNTGAAGANLDNCRWNGTKCVGTGNVVVSTSEFSTNTNGDGLFVTSGGLITLTNINANGNSGNGASLDNHTATLAKNVTLTGTNIFSNNGAAGLIVLSKGAIVGYNIIANSNDGGWGASLDNTSATTALGVTLFGSNQFKFNNGGLNVLTDGAITLNNITASNNISLEGALLHNDTSTAGSGVTLTGVNTFNQNHNDGLAVFSKGAITLNNVTAGYNGTANNHYGAELYNNTASVVKNVLLNGTNNFNGNFGGGLLIQSKGAITVSKATANGNENNLGISLTNTDAPNATPQNVLMPGYVNASRNGGTGLQITSKGAITLYNVTASNNDAGGSGNGANLDNSAVAVKSVVLLGINTFDGNGGSGLSVASKGVVTLFYVNANGNGSYGGLIDNNANNLAPQNINVMGYGHFSTNGNDGLNISTFGLITLNNIIANGNAGWGAHLDNRTGGLNTLPRGITLNGTNTFNGNTLGGLSAVALGPIRTNNLTASNNLGGDGAFLNNQGGTSNQTVIMTGINYFENNSAGFGLQLLSYGAVTLNNLNANWNHSGGARVITDSLTTVGSAVTLTGSNTFLGNNDNGIVQNDNGLYVASNGGNITVSNLTANWNGASGAILDNSVVSPDTLTVLPFVKLTGANNFIGNTAGTGLFIISLNTASVTKVTADSNVDGLNITSNGNATVTCGSMTNNTSFGWFIFSPHTVQLFKITTMIGVFSYGNGTDTLWQGGNSLVTVRACPLP